MDIGLGFIYRFFKDIYSYLNRNKRSLTNSEIIDLREKWRPEFEERIRERHLKKLGMDVIIRDISRADEYPNIENKKGISAWFKVGLVGTYHRGVLLLLSWESLVQDEEGIWRFSLKGEEPTLTAGLVGYVKFENIQQINWDGDEFYSQSHIFCHFAEKNGEPYEMIKYCERRELDGWPYYSELATFEQVKAASKKAGAERY